MLQLVKRYSFTCVGSCAGEKCHFSYLNSTYYGILRCDATESGINLATFRRKHFPGLASHKSRGCTLLQNINNLLAGYATSHFRGL